MLNTDSFRAFFKKWLDFEKRMGDEEGAEAVRRKAQEWVRGLQQ